MAGERKCLSFCVRILSLLNLWPSDNEQISEKMQFFRDISLMLSVTPCALPVLADFIFQLYEGINDFTALVDTLLVLNCIVAMFYMALCFIKNRKLIKILVNEISMFDQYGTSPKLQEIDDKANLYCKVFIFYGALGNFLYMLMPQLSIEACRESKNQNIVDDGVPCGLITRSRLPFKFDYTPLFEIVLLLQAYTCTMVTMVILAIAMLLCGILMHIIHQLNYLKSFIKRFEESKNQQLVQEVYHWIKYHNSILEYSEKTKEAFSSYLLTYLTLAAVVLSILGFRLLTVQTITDAVRCTVHLIGLLILLLLICHYGQLLEDESISISHDVYSIDWFELPVDIQKKIKMIIMRSQKPLTISASNLEAFTLPTFLQVSSSAYSFFTLLLNIKS